MHALLRSPLLAVQAGMAQPRRCWPPASLPTPPAHALSARPQVGFGGWARMAQPLDKFAITEVRKPRVGENKPAAVTAEVTINTAGEGGSQGLGDGLLMHGWACVGGVGG